MNEPSRRIRAELSQVESSWVSTRNGKQKMLTNFFFSGLFVVVVAAVRLLLVLNESGVATARNKFDIYS